MIVTNLNLDGHLALHLGLSILHVCAAEKTTGTLDMALSNGTTSERRSTGDEISKLPLLIAAIAAALIGLWVVEIRRRIGVRTGRCSGAIATIRRRAGGESAVAVIVGGRVRVRCDNWGGICLCRGGVNGDCPGAVVDAGGIGDGSLARERVGVDTIGGSIGGGVVRVNGRHRRAEVKGSCLRLRGVRGVGPRAVVNASGVRDRVEGREGINTVGRGVSRGGPCCLGGRGVRLRLPHPAVVMRGALALVALCNLDILGAASVLAWRALLA